MDKVNYNKNILWMTRMRCNFSYFIFILFISLQMHLTNSFTCQGKTYDAALKACPDRGSQLNSNGGNVSVLVKFTNNLTPRTNIILGGSKADPYVLFRVGTSTFKTSFIRDTIQPVWNELVNLGVLGSATDISVEVWNHNEGLLAPDNLIAIGSVRVPFCSTFSANFTKESCGTTFGCSAEGSSWASPYRKICNETGTVSFVNGGDKYSCTNGKGSCLFVDIVVIPFQMQVEIENPFASISTPVLSAFGDTASAEWTKTFGLPFLYDSSNILDTRIVDSEILKGALMWRMDNREKSKGRSGALRMYISINFPANIYICRYLSDNLKGVPTWITDNYSDRNRTATRVQIRDTETVFECYFRYAEATIKNKYNGLESNEIAFYTNTIPGYDTSQSTFSVDYDYMYIILAYQKIFAPREEDLTIVYDSGMFLQSIGSYGFIFAIFMWIITTFLHRINYRLDRIPTYLVTRVLSGDEKSCIAGLFITYEQSPMNIEFRAHLFHSCNSIYIILLIPFFLLIGWGSACIVKVRPTALGFAIIFVGNAAILLWFALKSWEKNNWRMTTVNLIATSMAIVLFLCYIISIVFVDKAVVAYEHNINFAGLSIIFGTINIFPLLFLIFKEDKMFKINMKVVVDKMSDALFMIKNPLAKAPAKRKHTPANKLLHALLGNAYTINPKVPLFNLGTVLPEPPNETISPDAVKEGGKNVEIEEAMIDNDFEKNLYNGSLLILFIYLMIGISRTDYPSLAFLNCLTLMLFDSINSSLSAGDLSWSPGFKIGLLIIGRLLIMGSAGETWLLTYSLAYLTYAICLLNEVINNSLPLLTKRQASEVAFCGEVSKKRSPNIAGSPNFCLGTLTFAFIGLLLVAAFGGVESQLPTPSIDVSTYLATSWPVYVFGLIAVLAVVTGGLLSSTSRAFYLSKHGLLRGWARDSYMLKRHINVPIILASFSEVALLSDGIIIYAVTKSAAILILFIFVPPIIALLAYSHGVWVGNDYDLVIWPPREDEKAVVDNSPSDMEVAFHMIENLFTEETGNEQPETDDDGIPQEKTLKGFKLPPLETTSTKIDGQIKMPPLPLKSVLRKKRENLGIKVKNPIVKDLRARDGAEDADAFGNGGDIIDVDDPWARFEENDDDSQMKSKKKANEWSKFQMKERGGFSNHPYVIMIRDTAMAVPALRFVITRVSDCLNFANSRLSAYAKIALNNDDEDAVDEEKKEEDNLPESENLTKMSFWNAYFGGYLSWNEYRAVLSFQMGMILIFIMGITLAGAVNPSWVGTTIWVACWMAVLTYVVLMKFFNTYVVDKTMWNIIYFTGFFHFMYCVIFFGTTLGGSAQLTASLWIFDYFFYYPICLYSVFELYKWIDDGFLIAKLDREGLGHVSIADYIAYFKAYPIIFVFYILLVWQFYIWIDPILGQVATIMLLTSCIGYIFIRDLASNEFFLSYEYGTIGDLMMKFIMFVTFLTSLFSATNPLFAISVFFFALIFQFGSSIAVRLMIADPDTIIFFSPFIMPVYSYDPRTNDLIDESPIAKNFLSMLICGALWGAFMAMFLYPVNVGVSIACVFLLVIVAIVCTTIAYIPLQLGRLASMITIEGIAEASDAAKTKFAQRKLPLNLEMSEYEDSADNWTQKKKTQLELLKEKSSLQIASELLDESMALYNVRDDDLQLFQKDISDEEVKITWRQQIIIDMKEKFNEVMKYTGFSPKKGWKRHCEALFNIKDAIAEMIVRSAGPMGWLGFNGYLYKFFLYCRDQPNLKFVDQTWLHAYDNDGNNKETIKLSETIHSRIILTRLSDLDEALDFTYSEETRCAIHFLLLLLVGADAKMQREQVLFQKFLRENRFRLASNGISPPAEIFSSSSFASIDIPLVAVWLSTLTSEEIERFFMLKTTFSDEQKERDAAIDAADFEKAYEAITLKQSRLRREQEVADNINRELARRQQNRINAFVSTISATDGSRFLLLKDAWLQNADIYVQPKDQPLYEKFKAAIFTDQNESTEYAREVLAEIEAAQKDCRIGEYGRAYQFVDSEFAPGDMAIGTGGANQFILGWRCAPGVSDIVQLFHNGTNPDDVQSGIFKDDWLLSAITMIASAGGAMDGEVAPQVNNLFVGHYAADGELTHHTEVGGYCVQLYKQGIWNPMIIDDCLPMLRHENWTNENKGVACAHSKECTQIWVSLIEKAFAKYYGSYSELEHGFVHHALEDMTGAEAECLTLAYASRGAGKRALWDQLVRFRKNGYILGAGTGAAALADKEIQDMGIVFNAAYTIYEVCSVDGNKLLKLRNPPGDHEEWKGDWSDKSSIWNKRLKKKLGHTDADDNTFFMSFDDFCNVFRELYVCKWYDPNKWKTISMSGEWKKSQESIEINVNKDEEDEKDVETQIKEAQAKVSTAGGLPTKHNPGCQFENNPQYSLRIHRPTEIRIKVTQADSRGRANSVIQPFTIMIAKCENAKFPTRVKTINKENVIACLDEPKKDRTQFLYAALKPGLYVVIVPTYVAGTEGNFTISLLSNYRSDFGQLWPPKWMADGRMSSEALQQELLSMVAMKGREGFNKMTKLLSAGMGKLAGIEDDDDDDKEDVDTKYMNLKF